MKGSTILRAHYLLLIGTLLLGPPKLLAAASPESESGDSGETTESDESVPDEKELTTLHEEIVVLDRSAFDPFISELDPASRDVNPAVDGGEMLRGVPGLALGRMGGHGLEPRIHGLGETNINVLVDGAYIHGGCPNRMDPPTSYAASEAFDRVVVYKGVQTLRYGGGGSAGTVLFERTAPSFSDGQNWSLDLGAAYTTYSAEPELALDAVVGASGFYAQARVERMARDDYEDGDGIPVRSAFTSSNTHFSLGWAPGDSARNVELSYELNRAEDALFAGAGMDSPEGETETWRLRLEQPLAFGPSTLIDVDIYSSRVDHLMDNYSLRPLTAPMAMAAPSESDTVGGRVSVEFALGAELELVAGIDTQENERWALRYAGPNSGAVTMLQSVLWPETRLRQVGLFTEGVRGLNPRSGVRFGLRVDRYSASAALENLKPAGMNRSPAGLYAAYYGTTADDWESDEVSGLLRYERHMESTGIDLFAGVSRSVRQPDSTERYLASNSMAPARRWIGSPQLNAATHHQLDLGLLYGVAGRSLTLSGFFDRVDDFILRDRAHGQNGVLLSDNATIYRNVEAELYGVDIDGRITLGDASSLSANASWVYAENRTDRRPIAQIPPLQGQVRAETARGSWMVSATLRGALRQTRVDDDPRTGSGLDAGETPSYLTADLAATWDLPGELRLLVGAENVFDRAYANHLNRSSAFDPQQVRVNEPGRTLWIRVAWSAGDRP